MGPTSPYMGPPSPSRVPSLQRSRIRHRRQIRLPGRQPPTDPPRWPPDPPAADGSATFTARSVVPATGSASPATMPAPGKKLRPHRPPRHAAALAIKDLRAGRRASARLRLRLGAHLRPCSGGLSHARLLPWLVHLPTSAPASSARHPLTSTLASSTCSGAGSGEGRREELSKEGTRGHQRRRAREREARRGEHVVRGRGETKRGEELVAWVT